MDTEELRRTATRQDAIRWVDDKGILTVPDGITDLAEDFGFFISRADLPHVRVLVIPASVTRIEPLCGDGSAGPYGFKNDPFCEIIVDKNNPRYKSEDGVLFTKDGKHLICYPRGRIAEEYTVPDGVETIVAGAFLEVPHLRRLYFPQSLHRISSGAILFCDTLDLPQTVEVFRVGLHRVIRLRLDIVRGTAPVTFRFRRDEDRDLEAIPVTDFDEKKAHPAGIRARAKILRLLRRMDYFCFDKPLDDALEKFSEALLFGEALA